jgi:beta-galactosidase
MNNIAGYDRYYLKEINMNAAFLVKKCAAILLSLTLVTFSASTCYAEPSVSFDSNWMFHLGEVQGAENPAFDDSAWRKLDVPHDWAIELPFDKSTPTSSGFLPGGVGWYRKTFALPAETKDKLVFIEFDGVYMDATFWLNGHKLGNHPYGYTGFQYDLTPFTNFGDKQNTLAVRVEVKQPCSRWYSGAGIYRHVWLKVVEPIHIAHWGTYVTTPEINKDFAKIHIRTHVLNQTTGTQDINLETIIVDRDGKTVAEANSLRTVTGNSEYEYVQFVKISKPYLWSPDNPYLYKVILVVKSGGKTIDKAVTPLGVRSIYFDPDKGLLLNGRNIRLNGVCMHHDMGPLGAAVNRRAIERQLEIMKAMGCNAIRTSHNPPAPELLDLCDSMGFMVMAEVFDEWKQSKTEFGYGRFFDEWAEKDILSLIHRDRNHPSIIIWSVGNEIEEQKSKDAEQTAGHLVDIFHREDPTRSVTSGCNSPDAAIKSRFVASLDVMGFNYCYQQYPTVHKQFPDWPLIASETSSALSSRGVYYFAEGKPIKGKDAVHPDMQCNSYDVDHPFWGYPAETSLLAMKNNPYVAGEFVWTGFDYIGEPTPYDWPARSSYFGIVDLCGFPKDRYYLYQSRWGDKPVVHILPHWNWQGREGEIIPVWCYSNADSVKLFLNEKSLGSKSFKDIGELHLTWEVPYRPGTLKAVATKDGKVFCTTKVKTAGNPAGIVLSADRSTINADGADLSFITAKIVDAEGTHVPNASDLISFNIEGPGKLIAVCNGNPLNHESFQAKQHSAFNGLCLVIIQSENRAGNISITATAKGLKPNNITIESK